jgi:pimeloyl-ACP methyl ester carboxylesterase
MIRLMPTVKANGIEICYETQGNPAHPPLLLIMGLGSQLVRWPPAFRAELEGRGYFLIYFDNRDVGKSTHFDAAGAPDIAALFAAVAAGEKPTVAYTLDDMADDAAGLLAALAIESAHVLGASLGGMVAQTLAIRHPERVRSLTSVMSTTGNPAVPPGKPEVTARLMLPPGKSREEAIERAVETDRLIGSQVFPFEEALCRKRAALAYDRAFDPRGVARQFAAVLAHGDRRAGLAGLRMPALVIHGTDDLLVRPEGGRDTAAAIPGAELVMIEGMAHDLPSPIHARIGAAVDAVVARASG